MNIINKDIEYQYLINDIMNNKEFKQLENIAHHGETRLDHSLKVSYYSYKISKFLKLSYKETARAGLLHDFYFDRTKDYKNIKKKIELFTIGHPSVAVDNASMLFELTDKEKDIIKTHMFPVSYSIPKYLESWIVSLVDKCISTYEFSKKFNYQISTALNIWLLLFINIKK